MPALPTAAPAGAVRNAHRVATTAWTLVVPLAVLGAGAALAASWRGDLPDPVASHWGAHGADGTASLTGTLAVMVGTGAAVALVCWVVALLAGRVAAVRRALGGISTGLAVFLCVLVVGSLAIQRGLAEAHQARDLGALPAVATVAGLVLGGLAAAATPGDAPLPATGRVPPEAPRARIAGTAGASWTGTAAFARPGVAVSIAAAFVVALGLLTRSAWITLPIAVVLGLVGVMIGRWTVTVDERGLVARTVLPRPRVTVPLDEVESAEVVQVDPLREFGGWGYRVGRRGRTGVVLRAGEGILVHRSGGRRLVVTVDDARRGAALLNTLVERRRR